ncbi:MAG: hypothetical protein K8R48_04300 [Alphaproteobacteria bacterium]|nr:hypothetical protein [Alphaproteobacteria bacterium]
MTARNRSLSKLLAEFPRFVAMGLTSAPVRDWLQKHARADHIILSNTLAGAHIRRYDALQQVRYNNAEIIMLAGAATRAFYHYRYYAHAQFVLLPLDLNILRLKSLGGWLRYVTRRKLKPAGIYRTGSTRWLALKVTKPRSHAERVYAPDTWRMSGLIQRLNKAGYAYALLRWWEQLEHWPEGEDSDILTTDHDSLAIRSMLEEHLGTLPIDLYSVSGGTASGGDSMAYYPPHLAEGILSRAEKGPLDCLIPSAEDAFFSLAYHALYHKGLASGLPTTTGLRPDPYPKHDFKGILLERARRLHIPSQHLETMETLDAFLAEKEWQPPRDMLSRYSHRNSWVKKHFFSDQKSAFPPGLCVFILREAAEKWQAIDAIRQELVKKGFHLLEEHVIPPEQRAAVSRHLRGGNWSPGPWPAAGGAPAHVLVMADLSPKPLRGKQKKASPNVDNARILYKNVLRDKINAQHPAKQRANFIHTSDNTGEALDYMHTVFSEEHKNKLYGQFLKLRAHKE